MLTDAQQRRAAKKFADEWKNRVGNERSECQPFWLALLRDVYGIQKSESFINFEVPVKTGDYEGKNGHGRVDAIIPSTLVYIEHKSRGIDLTKQAKQSDGVMLTPYQQAKRYGGWVARSEYPRWIVVCNFTEIIIYDMEKPQDEPRSISVDNLGDEYRHLNFLVNLDAVRIEKDKKVSEEAGVVVRKLYDALKEQYSDKESVTTLHSLNVLCVRLVFLFYADSAGLFGSPTLFHDYVQRSAIGGISNVRGALIELFKYLDTPEVARDEYAQSGVEQFPYVNGELFRDSTDAPIVIPRITEEIVDIILSQDTEGFNWREISPTIFGSIFEGTLNSDTRRSGGMHYTSIENIHKVVDPLFLTELRAELDEIKAEKQLRRKYDRLAAYQTKLASLKFLDPACGSGNFLTETYLHLRHLENDVIGLRFNIAASADNIMVSIKQFYGIEINDFAVAVAKTALWIAESQMLRATEEIIDIELDFLPLKSYTNIYKGDALNIAWGDVVQSNELSYIMGNPPFVGAKMMSESQRGDIVRIFGSRRAGTLDYVAGWYYKAAEFIKGSSVRVAFVSTNSITQGEQVAALWAPLIEEFDVEIEFGYKTFKWVNGATGDIAAVHCVIIGFASAPPIYVAKPYTAGKTWQQQKIFRLTLLTHLLYLLRAGLNLYAAFLKSA